MNREAFENYLQHFEVRSIIKKIASPHCKHIAKPLQGLTQAKLVNKLTICLPTMPLMAALRLPNTQINFVLCSQLTKKTNNKS